MSNESISGAQSELEQVDKSAKLCMRFVSIEDDINDCRQMIDAPTPSKSQFKQKRTNALWIFSCLVIAFMGISLGYEMRPSIFYKNFHNDYYQNKVIIADIVTFIGFIPIIIMIIKAIHSYVLKNKAYTTAIKQQQQDKEKARAQL